jgi:hypothetical protein
MPMGIPALQTRPIPTQRDFFLGTFAPFLRASDNPMAMACFLFLTTPPLPPFPDLSVPCFLLRIALLTALLAARPYLAMVVSCLNETALLIKIAVGNLPFDRQHSVNLPSKACTATEQHRCAPLLGKAIHEVADNKYPDGTPFPAADFSLLHVLKNGMELHEHEDAFIRKDGSFLPVVFSASPLRIGNEFKGIVAGFRDDTGCCQTQEALQQSEKI